MAHSTTMVQITDHEPARFGRFDDFSFDLQGIPFSFMLSHHSVIDNHAVLSLSAPELWLTTSN